MKTLISRNFCQKIGKMHFHANWQGAIQIDENFSFFFFSFFRETKVTKRLTSASTACKCIFCDIIRLVHIKVFSSNSRAIVFKSFHYFHTMDIEYHFPRMQKKCPHFFTLTPHFRALFCRRNDANKCSLSLVDAKNLISPSL